MCEGANAEFRWRSSSSIKLVWAFIVHYRLRVASPLSLLVLFFVASVLSIRLFHVFVSVPRLGWKCFSPLPFCTSALR